ncbi:MAG: glutaredoxin family protein [Caldimonas sp.]
MRARSPRTAAAWRIVPLAAALMAALPAMAQFKVIGSDGRVTYTDRQPNATDGRVSALGARTPAEAAEPELPFELRQPASRYPVTLYTTSGACEPCTAARQLLKQRGVPFAERQVVSAEDSEALERLSGAREAPTVTIGTQLLRGLSVEVWNSYLDAAGYPRESKLPASYQYRPATPLVDRRETTTVRATPRSEPAATINRPSPAAAPTPGGIRF